MKRHSNVIGSFLTCAFLAILQICRSPGAPAQEDGNFVQLQNGWRIQSAARTPADGAAISAAGFDASHWHPATVPGTVLAALVDDGIYKNIFFGTNLATIPTAPFTNSWWFRRAFNLSREQAGEDADLIFDGINYRANVWLNGKQIAGAGETFGAFRIFKFDVSGQLKSGKNVLAVEVFPPQPGDFTMGFVDWNPTPPDHGMGLFRPVKLHFYKTVALENVFVESRIDHHTWRDAQLTIRADLSNHARHAVDTTVKGEIGKVSFSGRFKLQAGETRSHRFHAGK